MLQLGLIGDNIADSRAPQLFRLAAEQVGIDLVYNRFVPRVMGVDFDAALECCREAGVHGLNVTYPYKQRVMTHVTTGSDLLRRIGAANTIVFARDGARGFNTDHSGFMAAYRARFPNMEPGAVALVGAGGVGRAVAFALAELGATELRLIDTNVNRAAELARAIGAAFDRAPVVSVHDETSACAGADGVANCTPVGMVGLPGTPVPPENLHGLRWAFEAIYTPPDTDFAEAAAEAGATVLGGLDLFFHQGVHAFEILAGRAPTDPAALRSALADTFVQAA